MSLLTTVAWKGFMLVYGLTSLAGVYATAILKNGALWAKDTEEEKKELTIAQKKFWSLDREPLPGFKHDFFTTSKGTRLHYVVNADAHSTVAKDVVIFIHELHRNNILIAVDMPGYGGSDGLPAYGPSEVLESITEYIIGMRKMHFKEGKRVVLVTHDWGTLIGARLAAETKGLADHFVLTSAILPHLTRMNAINGWASAQQMLHTWLRQPTNTRLLRNAMSALSPVTTQFRRSFYIFCFNLPRPFSMLFATFGNYWFLRILHSLSKGRPNKGEQLIGRLNPKEAGEAMAITTGPSRSQLESASSVNGEATLKYGESVRNRIADRGMSEKIRLYREGLFLDKWEKSLELTAALYELTNSGNSNNDAIEGHLRTSATLMLGEHDSAFDQRLALNQVKEFLMPNSQVLIIKGVGHWVPLEAIGRRVLEKTVLWALSGGVDDKATATPFERMSDVRIIATV